ncbi:hypothetical protein LEP3755_10680 [Leptolyngbya sp. NIES-3755]|nr:hypothetical protein LEP3755_10680 [Leptolyngbya sp. NIES-3755]
MRILCNREPSNDRCNVELGRLYAGNYSSVESFIADSEHLEPVLEEKGFLYDDEDNEQEIHHWKLVGHEIHKPTGESQFDAVVILFYEPVSIGVPIAS